MANTIAKEETLKEMRESAADQLLLIVWALAVSTKCFDIFLLFKNFRGLYVLIKESVRDAVSFLVILFYICLVFGLISQLMQIGVYDLSLIEHLGSVFLAALGDFTSPNTEDTPETSKRMNKWIVFLLLQMVTNIVALNTLIAIIGDSYDRVQNDKESYDALQKVELLDELNDLYMVFKKTERNLVYFNIVSYATRGDQEGGDWKGRVKIISQTLETGLDQIRGDIGKKFESFEEKIAKQNKEIAKQNAESIQRFDKLENLMMELLSK